MKNDVDKARATGVLRLGNASRCSNGATEKRPEQRLEPFKGCLHVLLILRSRKHECFFVLWSLVLLSAPLLKSLGFVSEE